MWVERRCRAGKLEPGDEIWMGGDTWSAPISFVERMGRACGCTEVDSITGQPVTHHFHVLTAAGTIIGIREHNDSIKYRRDPKIPGVRLAAVAE